MERSILTPEAQRWVSAIVKLTSLTYADKMRWIISDIEAPNGALSINDALGDIPGDRFKSVRYEAHLEQQTFLLTISKPELGMHSSWSSLLGVPDYTPKYKINFRALDQSGRKVVDLTKLSVLEALANAVESQADNHASSVLEAIEKA